jgi:hypothetical protein
MERTMPVKSEDGTFPIVLELPTQGVKQTFRNSEDVQTYFDREAELWTDLNQWVAGDPLTGINIAQAAGARAVNELRGKLANAKADREYFTAIQQYVGVQPLVLQGSLGQIVLDRDGQREAQTAGVLWALSAMLGSNGLRDAAHNTVRANDLAAISFGQAKIANSLRRYQSERANIRRLEEELGDELAKAKATREALEQKLATATDDLDATLAKSQEQSRQLVEATEEAIGKFSQEMHVQVATSIKNSNQKLDDFLRVSTEETEKFKKRIRQDVGLEEPTNFWTRKAEGHRTAAILFGAVFLVAVVAMVIWIDMSAVELVADAVDRIVGDRDAAALTLVPIAFITIPALAFAWVLRHLSRIIIQNLSLEADARLRGTITMTFKALAADRTMNDAELAIALQALFRPIDGKDHSEIAPPSLADILRLGGDSKT